MEVDGGLGRPVVERKRDEAAERVQKLFQDFLEEFTITENGEKIAKYKGIGNTAIPYCGIFYNILTYLTFI